MQQKSLTINGVDVSKIINRNETRVAALIPELIQEYYPDFIFEDLDIQDIYALTLNLIPAGYAQTGSIVLSNRLSDFEINSKIRIAIERVLDNPTRVSD
ncbi:late competence development ComFB family protein [uncultured Pseudodesulfovibrio sp.]|uniref:late competence development ComFB family protein n=1 Tax=uncultured Pseudodesulfovibrio sp. TaxID=2035858 RepID=UPI0029C7B833|nr:late competence development ComFB family protein [uncultured Pseudodesulfovibrio sp.]